MWNVNLRGTQVNNQGSAWSFSCSNILTVVELTCWKCRTDNWRGPWKRPGAALQYLFNQQLPRLQLFYIIVLKCCCQPLLKHLGQGSFLLLHIVHLLLQQGNVLLLQSDCKSWECLKGAASVLEVHNPLSASNSPSTLSAQALRRSIQTSRPSVHFHSLLQSWKNYLAIL